MTIEYTKIDAATAALTLIGRLDTANAPLMEQKIRQYGKDITSLILDFSDLRYISSMGLRVLLQAKKELEEKNCALVIQNIDASVREVFQMTGFLHLLPEAAI